MAIEETTTTTKALSEFDASQSQALMSAPSGDRARSGSETLRPVVRAQENGARVSAAEDEGFNGDNVGVSGGSGFLGDAKLRGVSSSSEGERRDKAVNGTGCRSATVLTGDGSDSKVEVDHTGISLLVEVVGSLDSENGGRIGQGDDKAFMAENAGEIPGSASVRGENGDITREGAREHEEVNHSGKETAEDGEEDEGGAEQNDEDDLGENGDITGEGGREREEVNRNGKETEGGGEEDRGEAEQDDEDYRGRKYSVGDFVWGKIRSHPWWPGQVYDPSVASDNARKYNYRERLLVAYFGDGSFSWCTPSQLKPFAEDFEKMSKQSNSKSFVNAVKKALDEIGRLVGLKNTCSCVPEDNRVGLARPLAMNAGIKEGALVPECDLTRLLITQRPDELIATLRYVAGAVNITNMIELIVLRSWLSAFYRAKGGHELAVFHEPLYIEGLEDKDRNGVADITNFVGPVEVLVQGPSEEGWLSSPVNHEFDPTNQSLLRKCPGISEDKLYHRRKKRSVAELMKDDKVVETKYKKGSKVKNVTSTSRPVSTSGKKERKISEKVPSLDGGEFSSRTGRRRGRMNRAEVLGSPKSTEEVLGAKNGGGGVGEEGTNDKVSSIDNDDTDARGEIETASASVSPRERKKSKYLSPPFTSVNVNLRVRNTSSKRDSEAKPVKIEKVARMAERTTRDADRVVGSTPDVKCSDEKSLEKLSEELDTDTSANPIPQPPKDLKKIIDSLEINASTKKVVSGVRSAAINPVYLREKMSTDMIIGFISAFRSAIFLNGSNYKIYKHHQSGRKRKKLNSGPELRKKDLKQSDLNSPGSESQQTRTKKNKQAKSGKPKLKQADGPSDTKTVNKDSGREASKLASLIVTFPPGFSVPSKNDLITMFSKFGPLNETETAIISYCAKMVFVKSSDAEEAFMTSVKNSPFGPANVKFRLRYSSAASKESGSNPKKRGKTQKKSAASESSPVDEASRLLYIKQKLEVMTSMLEKSDGNMLPEMKSNLEGEMKSLLEKVSAMAQSTSS